ncbi:GntR family transcriptional regulator [Amycolatopsis endophytica]|uniref:DNA-binding GntR family transcriptional regulator n=1 Tax=Amycolatopsis endophytica TaxID=860233 RepID=A0A853B9W7_9PSEU|nr:GntR family transcriptional regulator [Amycolatopsis endophytica]NYI91481.1 DNA-binding GntR family transcriptional regulator [Amycolatopsis endophytica]
MNAGPGARPGPPQSKADYVYASLLDDLRNARISGGTPLRATEIAQRLGVSITPVREALRRLENDRLIRYEQNHGATVIDLSAEALVEYYNVRAVVEGLGARLAADHITREQLDSLWARHEQMVADEKAGRYDTLGEQSREFHLAITDIGGPAFLGGHARAVRNSFPVPAHASLWLDPDQARNHLTVHEQLLKALQAGDGAAAERIMIDHVRFSGHYRRTRD